MKAIHPPPLDDLAAREPDAFADALAEMLQSGFGELGARFAEGADASPCLGFAEA